MTEVLLLAPLLFDQAIGYWTGEPDRVLLARALLAVPQDPRVEREVLDSGVRLRGTEDAVLAEARRLREAGLQ